MNFKDTLPQFQIIDITQIEPNPAHPRQNIDESSLKGLANSIQKKGIIQPLIVLPANEAGRYILIVGERRWRAAVIAGEKTVPVLIHPCDAAEALEVQVFENLGLGMRAALEPRDMANAIQSIAERFDSREAAAEHFGRTPTWLNQATAAANLSAKVTALLDSGKVSSAGTAVQLEKLVQKNEIKAESLIEQAVQLPEGEKLAKKTVDSALSAEGGRRKKTVAANLTPEVVTNISKLETNHTPPWEDTPSPAVSIQLGIDPDKIKRVAIILGLMEGNEEDFLARLIDAFLALQNNTNT